MDANECGYWFDAIMTEAKALFLTDNDYDAVILAKPLGDKKSKLHLLGSVEELRLDGYGEDKPTVYLYKIGKTAYVHVDHEPFEVRKLVYDGLFNTLMAKTLRFEGIKLSGDINCTAMFEFAIIETLDLSWLDTTDVTSFKNMFRYAEINNLDIRQLNCENGLNLTGMFQEFSTNSELDLINFEFDELYEGIRERNMAMMFEDASIPGVRHIKAFGYQELIVRKALARERIPVLE